MAALACGLATPLLLILAMPGIGWWPILFAGLVPLLYSCLWLPARQCLGLGLACGFIYHLAQLYWIVIVLGRYGGLPLWISVPALSLLALYMGLYWGAFGGLLSLLAGRSWHRERPVSTLVWTAPVLWVGLDALRAKLFTGFPWMDIGYGLFKVPLLIQAADLGGHHLITFTLVLVNGLILAILDRQRLDVRFGLRGERRVLMVAVMFIIFVFGYSGLRYRVVSIQAERALQAQVVVAQGNIDQAVKWTEEQRQKTVKIYTRLSAGHLATGTTELVVWPETAVPFYLQQDPLAAGITAFTHDSNVWLLTGTPAYTAHESPGGAPPRIDYYNSAMLIAPDGTLAGMYAKQHLVPFGEYVPLRRLLPFLEPLVVSVGDFTAGQSSAPLVMGDMHIGVLICYESIFPEIARSEVASGANILANLTNDAWYGRSSAPHQSLAMAVFRAVENKRSLIRAANTGISCLVDPAGNILRQSPLFVETALSAPLPLLEKETVFARGGGNFGLSCLALILPLLLFRRR